MFLGDCLENYFFAAKTAVYNLAPTDLSIQ